MPAEVTDHPADAAQPGESQHAHFPCFDGLRAIAATAVVFHHVGFSTGYGANGRFGAYFAHGDSGVSVFFLISGFLLYRPFVARHLSGERPMTADRFWWRRLLRIFPGYWAALIGIYLVFGFRDGTLSSGGDFLAYFGLGQIYDPTRFFSGIDQAWSLATEISFYAFLPLYAWAIGRLGARWARHRVHIEIAGLVALVVTCVVWRFAWWVNETTVQQAGGAQPTRGQLGELATAYWLPSHFDLFALGMGLAVASAWVAHRGVTPRFVQWVGRVPELWWAFAAFTYWVVSTRVGLPRALGEGLTQGEYFTRQALYGLTALFLLLPAVFGDQGKGAVRRFLRWAPVAYVGLVSYGVYLWHKAWIGFVREDLLGHDEPIGGPVVSTLVIAFVFTLLTATVSYFVLERPILRFKDRPPWRRAAHTAKV
jgi:peptidoglycan/LPS O-acetylase OafA/YrhL